MVLAVIKSYGLMRSGKLSLVKWTKECSPWGDLEFKCAFEMKYMSVNHAHGQ